MNVSSPPRIVVLGFLSHFPVAGVAWQTVHYLIGFQRLGYDVYYVEAHGCTPSKLMQSETDDGPARAAAYIEQLMRRFGLEDRWAYHAPYESRWFGMSETRLKEIYNSAALIINLHGSHLPAPELTATGRLVYLETDPVDVQIALYHKNQETIDYLAPHCAFFSYGENLGQPDCGLPVPETFKFHPTRQPVVMDFWADHGRGESSTFTTIGNWHQPWREFEFQGQVYHWSKHLEFQKFLDLPGLVPQAFELALSSYEAEDQRLLESKGWRVRHALDLSRDLDVYREYIGNSRGEFTVAKDQNVRLRSGWFSDRAITYLAAGRPVITQETGFSNFLPTGEGLFGFSAMEEIVAAVETINGDYERHRRAAYSIAREYFSYEVVLGRLLRDLGVSRPGAARAVKLPLQVLPPDLVLAPISRWPTRLPEQTVQAAMALPPPGVHPFSAPKQKEPDKERGCGERSIPDAGESVRSACKPASLIMVTRGGLPYTKMCLSSLFASGWQPNDELIIVDNASPDGTPDYLRELALMNPFVRVVFNDRNRGFAAATNQALVQATGEVLILLNNDTIPMPGWREGLERWLNEEGIGMVGPVTNRTCNEAQIDAPYRTYGELEEFARDYSSKHSGERSEIAMLAMFCVAFRRHIFERVGPLDEQFEIGMFEDDDYSRRVRNAGLKLVCAEDVFVHHFGQGSLGELCLNGEYDRVLEVNRQRFEQKWGVTWKPHGRRITEDYRRLRERIRQSVARQVPPGATVIVISKGDDDLLQLNGHRAWHFPQAPDGDYANIYPANSAEAIAQLELLRTRGGRFLLIPKPAFWWLDHYGDFSAHLQSRGRLAVREEETCLIFDLEHDHA